MEQGMGVAGVIILNFDNSVLLGPGVCFRIDSCPEVSEFVRITTATLHETEKNTPLHCMDLSYQSQ
jgi:hypothetical protein